MVVVNLEVMDLNAAISTMREIDRGLAGCQEVDCDYLVLAKGRNELDSALVFHHLDHQDRELHEVIDTTRTLGRN